MPHVIARADGPLKAVIVNFLSISASYGALVWIFQDGHLGGLGTTPTGTLVANIPVLLFCIAFGLSMDYEVFILSRMREEYDRVPSTDRAVILGIARTGRLVTAGSLILFGAFAALAVFPLVWMVCVSLMPAGSASTLPPPLPAAATTTEPLARAVSMAAAGMGWMSGDGSASSTKPSSAR